MLGFHIYSGSKVVGVILLAALTAPSVVLVGVIGWAIYSGIRSAKGVD